MMTFQLKDGRMIRIRQHELTEDPTVTLLSPAGDWENYMYHMWHREKEIKISADEIAAWLMEKLGEPLDKTEPETLSLENNKPARRIRSAQPKET